MAAEITLLAFGLGLCIGGAFTVAGWPLMLAGLTCLVAALLLQDRRLP